MKKFISQWVTFTERSALPSRPEAYRQGYVPHAQRIILAIGTASKKVRFRELWKYLRSFDSRSAFRRTFLWDKKVRFRELWKYLRSFESKSASRRTFLSDKIPFDSRVILYSIKSTAKRWHSSLPQVSSSRIVTAATFCLHGIQTNRW